MYRREKRKDVRQPRPFEVCFGKYRSVGGIPGGGRLVLRLYGCDRMGRGL